MWLTKITRYLLTHTYVTVTHRLYVMAVCKLIINRLAVYDVFWTLVGKKNPSNPENIAKTILSINTCQCFHVTKKGENPFPAMIQQQQHEQSYTSRSHVWIYREIELGLDVTLEHPLKRMKEAPSNGSHLQCSFTSTRTVVKKKICMNGINLTYFCFVCNSTVVVLTTNSPVRGNAKHTG